MNNIIRGGIFSAKIRTAAYGLIALGCVSSCDVASSDIRQKSVEAGTGKATMQPRPRATGRAALGVNLGAPTYWSGERDFMNLTLGGNWRLTVNGRWVGTMDPSRIDPRTGSIRQLAPGEGAALMLTPPLAGGPTVAIRCTFAGKGVVLAGGSVRDVRPGPSSVEFIMTVVPTQPKNYWISLEKTDPSDPVRNVDCREANASRNAMFAPDFLESLKPFGIIRFMDWQLTNLNVGGKWSARAQPTSMIHSYTEGVAIEHMVALANQAEADPWFSIPFNADEEYIANFARYVHDHIAPQRTVYIEVGNEVWNYAFPVARQAEREGVALRLNDAPFQALVARYVQKSVGAFAIWSRIFADRPGKLVRVLGSQSANPWVAEQLLKSPETVKVVDAIGTAPYFGFNPSTRPEDKAVSANADLIFKILSERIDSVLEKDRATSVIAARYGKRHFAYEAGQHAKLSGNLPLLRVIQTDPRMYALYRRYLDQWRSHDGDVLVLFNATSPINDHGAWGLREYSGQPVAETPKRRAVLDYISSLDSGKAKPR